MSKYYYDRRRDKYRRLRQFGVGILVVVAGSMGSGLYLWHRSQSTQQVVQVTKKDTETKQPVSPRTSSLTWANPPVATPSLQKNLLELTNKERAVAGVGALTANTLLDQSAKAKCADMVTNNYWSHVDLTGQEPWHFIDATGYNKEAAGENLAYGFTSDSAVVQGWMNSPAHRKTLLDPIYTDVGFGVCESPDFVGSGKQTIVVQHFGRPLP